VEWRGFAKHVSSQGAAVKVRRGTGVQKGGRCSRQVEVGASVCCGKCRVVAQWNTVYAPQVCRRRERAGARRQRQVLLQRQVNARPLFSMASSR